MPNESRAVGGRRYRRSEEEKAELIERWCESGLSRAEFCRREGISYGSFLGWIASWLVADAAEPAPEFVEVMEAESVRSPAQGESHGIELLAPDGWRVRVSGGFASEDLKRVLEVLGRC
jgi:transposase-like protein